MSAAEILAAAEAQAALRAQVKFLGGVVARLACVKFEKISERQLCEGLDRVLNVSGELPCDYDIQRIKDLAWKYRRQMPPHAAPRLPPRDPVVREMGL